MSKSNGKILNIVHAQTQLKTTFLLVDENGDAIDSRVVQYDVFKLKTESFADVLKQLQQAKEKLKKEVGDA